MGCSPGQQHFAQNLIKTFRVNDLEEKNFATLQ